MNVLVTGHQGYIGSVMTLVLHAHGHRVVGMDTGYFAECQVSSHLDPAELEFVKDIRDASLDDFEGIDSVVHLAALSDDPLGKLNPELTDQINHLATVELARKAREAGVSRFIFSASCSMYGVADGDGALTEEAPFNPVTPYGKSKVDAEAGLRSLATDEFSPVFLRNATAYGLSPRLRVGTLVLNNLVCWAVSTGSVRVKSDGTPWRPLVHVEDICGAAAAVLDAPREAVHNQAFNVGQDGENFQVRDIAEMVRQTVPGCEVVYTGESRGDKRSYRVSFEKISKRLPEFHPKWTMKLGAEELYRFLKELNLTPEMFQGRTFVRLAQLQHLMESGQIGPDLLWAAGKRERVR